MKNAWKVLLISLVGVIAIVIFGIFGVQSFQNHAISLEEQVESASSDIKIQEKRRVDLVYNLADCVKQYDKHESETLKAIVSGRTSGSNDIENVTTAISAVSEAYPELKSSENYKQLMKIVLPDDEYIDTVKESSRIRYKYYGVGTKYKGTIFTLLKDKTISDKSVFYNNRDISETVEHLESDMPLILFRIGWILLTGLVVFGFYCLDNNWLE